MAARDIMPWRAPYSGGHAFTLEYDLLAGETFAEGEVVRLESASGQLEMAEDDPDPTIHNDGGTVGVAAEPAQGMATDAAGTTNPDFAPRTVWRFGFDQEFITPNFTTNGDESVLFTQDAVHAHVGVPVGLMLNTNVGNPGWGITTVGTNLAFRVTQILDANKQPIRDATTEATWVVFIREENSIYVPA